MTAEIAVMNRFGVALAADSAVTVGRQRVWKTVNKLFSLSPKNDIGVMFYGSADFIGYPWDTIVKEFRRSSLHTTFPTVEAAADAFFSFLKSDCFNDAESQTLSILSLFVEVAENLKRGIVANGAIDFRKKFISDATSFFEDTVLEEVNTISRGDFEARYRSQIIEFFQEIFKLKFTKAMRQAAVSLCYDAFTLEYRSEYATGIVFAGFGKDEMLPHLRDYSIDGRDGPHVRCWKERVHDLNQPNGSSGLIVPFGQSDMAYVFMEGISIDQEEYVGETLHNLLKAKSGEIVNAYVANADERLVEQKIQEADDKKIVEHFINEYRSYRRASVVQPVMSVVSTLPKEEMAAMAESLVDLTSLRRKVDSRIESVSGPIDVAFISKGDGFIWMKRKHYFDLALNRDFAARKAREQDS